MSQAYKINRVRVGDDIPALCGRCKAERTHVVVALHATGVPADVICRTCNNQHRFRPQGGAPKQLRAQSARRGAAAGKTEQNRAAEAAARAQARAYSTRATFAAGEWLAHPTLGLGHVTNVRGGKIDVQFDSGLRTLLHAG